MLVGRLEQYVDLNLASYRSTKYPSYRINFVGNEADEKQLPLSSLNYFTEHLLGVSDRNLTRRRASPYQLYGSAVFYQDCRC